MSIYFNQTNQTPGSTQFITRQEVIQGFSTLAGDLSGINISSFFLNPNPIVSSITVNPNGIITNPGAVRAGTFVVSTLVGSLTSANPYPTTVSYPAIGDDGANFFADLYAKSIVATNTALDSVADKLAYSYAGITGITAAGTTQGFLGWNSARPSGTQFVLSNVSTINGIPPGLSQGTFTSLTGSNITMSGVLNGPSLVGISSINGELYTASFNSNWTGSNNIALTNGVAAQAASIALPAGFLQPNQSYLYDIPIQLGAFPANPTGFTLLIGARMGQQGQINYSIPLYVNPSAQNISLSLTGIGYTGPVVGTNTADVIMVQFSGSNWTVPVFNPTPGPGNPNAITMKAI